MSVPRLCELCEAKTLFGVFAISTDLPSEQCGNSSQ